MPEESTTPDLVELVRRSVEAVNQRDFDGVMSFWGPDPVWDTSPMGLGVYEGTAAIRRFFEDWIGAYEEWEIEPEELLDLGNGIVLAVFLQTARPVGSIGHVQIRYAAVTVLVEGMIVRIANYSDIEEARAAAERLAQERPMAEDGATPEVVESVLGIWADVDRRDFDAVLSLFAPDAVLARGLITFEGRDAVRGVLEDTVGSYEDLESEVEQVRDLGCGVVFAVVGQKGHLVGSSASVGGRFAWVYQWVDGTITRVTIYLDIDEARAAAERLVQERG
jgi:ketosteroid isomerase-like protein